MENTETVLDIAETLQTAVVADPQPVELQQIIDILNNIQGILYLFLLIVIAYLVFKLYFQVFNRL